MRNWPRRRPIRRRAPGALWEQAAASAKLYAGLPVSIWQTLVDMVEGNQRGEESPVSSVGVVADPTAWNT